jgi:HK97 family phage portal protein
MREHKPGLLSRLFAAWMPQTISNLDAYSDVMVSGGVSSSGVAVSTESAFTVAAFFSGVQQIAQTVASLPLDIFQRRKNSKKYLPQYPLNEMLKMKVNPIMSAYTYKELTIINALIHGNAYWLIERDKKGRVSELWPLSTTSITPRVGKNGRSIEYIYSSNNTQVIFPRSKIHHVMGLSRDGLVGMNVLQLARETLGVAIAQEGFQGSYYGNGAQIGGALKHPAKLSKEAHEKLASSVKTKYQGFTNAHKIMILEEGMEFQPFQLNLVDAQFLDSRSFQIQEIARWLNMPPHKLKDLSRATFSNIESEQVSWLQDTIRPWLVRHEQAINTQLLSDADILAGYYSEYNPDAILRATPTARFAAYREGLMNGWMNRNEVRSAENLNPMPGKGGEVYTVQGAMIDIESLGSKPVDMPIEDAMSGDPMVVDENTEDTQEEGIDDTID